ncbi:MAG: glycosyltransferase family 9 protein [Chlamydiota bacterium]
MRLLKNGALRALAKLLKKKGTPPSTERFLVVSTTGLGDSLWALPSINGLRHHFPECTLDVLMTDLGRQLFEYNPDINQRYLLPERLLDWYRLRNTLIERQYHTAFVFHSSQRAMLPLLACSGIPHIIGTKGEHKGLGRFLTQEAPPALHEIERRENLIRLAGASIVDPTLRYRMRKEERNGATAFRMKNGRENPVVFLHPGAKDRYKCWPISHYIALGKRLEEEIGCTLWIGIGKGEDDLGAQLQKHLPNSRLIAHQSIRSYAATLVASDLLITNDTGPMHLACACKHPVIALFSPTDPHRCGPYETENACTIVAPRTCTPCLSRSCRLPFCLRQISVDTVFEHARSILKKVPLSRS